MLFRNFPNWLRVDVVAPEARRVGTLMLDRALDRAAARQSLGELRRPCVRSARGGSGA